MVNRYKIKYHTAMGCEIDIINADGFTIGSDSGDATFYNDSGDKIAYVPRGPLIYKVNELSVVKRSE